MRSVVHAALNAVRQDKRSLSLDADPAVVENLLAQAASVESQIEFAQLAGEIIRSLSKRSPRQRAVIVQQYYLEMSEQEMAGTKPAVRAFNICTRCSKRGSELL